MTNMNLVIAKDRCIHCGLCVKDCSAKALVMGSDNVPKIALNGEKRCFECQHCLSVCPVGALSILGKNPENSNPVLNNINPEDFLNLMQSRRSVRRYKHENVSNEIMQKLKDMLKFVPTGCNNHGLYFSIIDDVDVMDKFRDRVNQKVVKTICNKTVKIIAKKFGHYLTALESGEDVIFRGAPHMIVVSVPKNAPCKDYDPTIALSYFELYAQSMGIGTCWCGFAYAALEFLPELQGQFKIPKSHKLGYVMLFGNPDIKYSRTPQPKEIEIIEVKDEDELKLNLFQKINRIISNI